MNEKPSTLVILSPGFPKNENDSTCLPAQQSFIRSLNKISPALKIIILSFEYPFPPAEYTWHNNEVITFGGRNRRKFFRIRMWVNVWRRLKSINKRAKIYGLLSLWCTETALIGKAFAKKYELKHFCWILGQDARKENRMIKFIRPSGSELIAMSDFLATEFLNNYKIKPLHIIPNGIDPSLFSQNSGEKDIHISGAGSLIHLKRYDIFIDVVNEIHQNIPSVKAVLCGKGGKENDLRSLLQTLEIQNNITLPGEIPHAEVLKIMQRSKIFLHPSTYEGFSSSCLEALYAGAHVISYFGPMNIAIPHWHVVKDKDEMLQKALELLQNSALDRTPVMPYLQDDCAGQLLQLFSHQRPTFTA